MRIVRAVLCCLIFSLSSSAYAQQPKENVDVLLVLAADVSGSISRERWEIQQSGYAAAFNSPDVLHAIQRGRHQRIAVIFVQWAGMTQQKEIAPWSIIAEPIQAEQFSNAILAARRFYSGDTSISQAIQYSMQLIESAPFNAVRKVIDISGDGEDNAGVQPDKTTRFEAARKKALEANITINGLPIAGSEINIFDYYERRVIIGRDAFIEPVTYPYSVETFTLAVRKKLIREIALLIKK